MHPLLGRQLRKAFADVSAETPELAKLLALIDDAYAAADDERRQLERSLGLASDELFERNRRLEHELAERNRLEAELQHAEKLRTVGQLAAGIAHEINTPIQFIGDSLSFLVDALGELGLPMVDGAVPCEPLPEDLAFLRSEIPKAVARCQAGTERVANIVRALKCLAHPDNEQQQLADLHAAINNTLVIVASELKYVADIQLDLAARPMLRCYIGEIQQVLINLLVNAGHAIGDRVRESGGRGMIRIATRTDGADLVTTISDTGAGIPPEVGAHIFEAFFTTKPIGQGTGQGLSIAHAMIVDHHAGRISFESTVGEGTTFTIRLPYEGRPIMSRTMEIAVPA